MPLPRFLNFSMPSQKNLVFPLNVKLGWLDNVSVLRQEKDVNRGAFIFNITGAFLTQNSLKDFSSYTLKVFTALLASY